jgi:enoyl-CoA hydratase
MGFALLSPSYKPPRSHPMLDQPLTSKMLAEKDGPVGRLIFNNPARHNAVSLEMWQAVAQIMEDFENDDAIRVIVVTGAGGKAFVSGADISEFKEKRSNEQAAAEYAKISEAARVRLNETLKPTIAMIRGYCIGGGLGLAVCCDLRICSDNSKFGIPAAKLGLGYSYPGVKRLTDIVGPSFAKEIFFTARQFDAEEARTMRLVNRVVSAGELENYVKNYADTIANNAPLTVKTAKFIANETMRDESKRNLARCAELVEQCFKSNDYTEGRKAFMEKRKPAFTGT